MPLQLNSQLMLSVILVFSAINFIDAKSYDAIKLSDVQVLTLYNGKMTNGRRSASVPQLKCVGGSAGCYAFIPQVVQCYNRGSDGIDYQWECTTDMDNAYRFGQVSVSCEGYSYPDDPYILKGSCGLEYTIDLTSEGYEKQRKSHTYYGDDNRPRAKDKSSSDGTSIFGDILFFVIVGFMIYALYKTCIRPMAQNANQFSTTNDDFGGYPGSDHQAPPPPGFRSDFFTNPNQRTFPSTAGCGPAGSATGATGPAGGFWTGAATGGLLGYMFGRRNNAGASTYEQRSRPSTYESRYSYTSPGTSSGGTSSFESSGTRTASGFGGTTRR